MERINTAIQRKKPDRVPVVMKIHSWAAQYYGYSVKEVYSTKPELAYDIFTKLTDEFNIDALFHFNFFAQIPAIETFGGGSHYRLCEDGIQVCNQDCRLMNEDGVRFVD
jgi:hypothetical protein